MTRLNMDQAMGGANERAEMDAIGVDKITSVERIFPALISTCKLSGGHPFKHRDARLMVAYRVAMVLLTRFLRGAYFTPVVRFNEGLTQESNQINVTNFFVLYLASDLALSISSIITGALYHRTMALVLRKRLDRDYLRPISSWVLSTQPARHEGQQQPPDGCHSESRDILRGLNQRLKRRREAIELKLDQSFVHVNEVTLVRCSIVFAIMLTAATTFIREEYVNHLLARSSFNSSAVATSVTATARNAALSHATRRHLSYLQLVQEATLPDLSLQIACDLPVVGMAHLTLAVLEIFQNYGQIGLGCMSTACMTEMLKRITEQESARLARERSAPAGPKLDQRGSARATPSETKSIDDPQDSPAPLIQTTELLVHIRDVLITLRSALSLDYLFANIFDVCRLITVVGSLLALMGARRHGWVLITAIEFLRINIINVTCRLSYHRLHAEASRVKGLIYERLVRGHMDESARSFEADSRIETITNYRVAKEIEELWPTDWFLPDIKSCLSQNLLVITFVATLQQLVEMRSQLK